MLRHRGSDFGLTTILLHWLIAILFVGQIACGFLMERLSSAALQFAVIQWHKSFGLLALAVALLRIVWSLASRRVVPEQTLSSSERTAANVVQHLLLLATVAVPLAGWALVSVSTLDIPTLAFNRWLVPALPMLPRSDAAEAFWANAHAWLAYASAALAVGHASAALYHHAVRRDRVLVRMLRPGHPSAAPASEDIP